MWKRARTRKYRDYFRRKVGPKHSKGYLEMQRKSKWDDSLQVSSRCKVWRRCSACMWCASGKLERLFSVCCKAMWHMYRQLDAFILELHWEPLYRGLEWKEPVGLYSWDSTWEDFLKLADDDEHHQWLRRSSCLTGATKTFGSCIGDVSLGESMDASRLSSQGQAPGG